ncbi:MAG: methyltransferase domain-containing protein [Planctomycetota bacterium]|nr:methyltransferase domain-containing protein [Planctomycetota bacterium]
MSRDLRQLPPPCPRQVIALAVLCLVFLGGCSGLTARPDENRSTLDATPKTSESSVRPGINDVFVNPELNVDEFVAVFEGESREVAVHREDIVARLGLRSGDAVADIGAGTGLFMEPLAQAVGPTGSVLAVDISKRFVEHLQARASQSNLLQVQAVLCTEDAVRLPAESLDVAFVCDTYHHFEFPQATLESIRKALKPGGQLVLVDFKRIPGVSREWILNHVRLGQEEVIAEVLSAGFQLNEVLFVNGLEENYMVSFDRPKLSH